MTDLRPHYDVVCVGGALIGSSCAYFLSEDPDFDGTILVVEADPSYQSAMTSRSSNSIREQFSNPLNIEISQFGMAFIDDFHRLVEVDGSSPSIDFRGTGYLFLAADDAHLAELAGQCELHRRAGARSRMLTPQEVSRSFPYLDVGRISGARFGSRREGSFDGWSLFEGLRRRGIANGVTHVHDRVVGLETAGGRVRRVVLESGRSVSAGQVVNAAGPRAKEVAEMVGLPLPVEPRARTTFVFDCRTPIEHDMPLTVTPEGVHFRRERRHYVAGGVPPDDRPVDYDDLAIRHDEFEDQIWPVVASYVPVFDRVSIVTSWGGQYAYNPLDHNLIIGPAPDPENLLFANGFSGHGLQQAPAVGRAISELIVHGGYRTIDMTPLGYDRILRNEPFPESVVI